MVGTKTQKNTGNQQGVPPIKSRRSFLRKAGLAVVGLGLIAAAGGGVALYSHRQYLKTANRNEPTVSATLEKIRNVLNVKTPTGITGTSAGSNVTTTLAAPVEGEPILVPKGSLNGPTYIGLTTTEDSGVANHDGVDWVASTQAAVKRQLSVGTGGASTLAMQLARHLEQKTNQLWMEEKELLNEGKNKTAKQKQEERKARETAVARAIVQEFPSWLDLTHAYLMLVPMGQSKGFATAALRHFGVSPADLKDLAKLKFEQICQLLGSLSNPNTYGPKPQNSNSAKRNIIAKNLINKGASVIASIRGGRIEQLAYSIPILKHIVPLIPVGSGRGDAMQEELFDEIEQAKRAGHITELSDTPATNEVTKEKSSLAQFLQLVREPAKFYTKYTENDPKPDLYSNVETTLDPKIQEILVKEMERAKKDLKLEKCGGAVIDLEGKIKAFTGLDTHNPANAGIPAGSSLKPLLYSLWLGLEEPPTNTEDSDADEQQSKLLPHENQEIQHNQPHSLDQTLLDDAVSLPMPPGQPAWAPGNAGKPFTDESQTLRQHLISSHNNAVAWLLKHPGMWDKLSGFMTAVGFESWPGANDGFKPAAALGASEKGTNILEISRILLSLLTNKVPDRLYAVKSITNVITGDKIEPTRNSIDTSNFISDAHGAEIMSTLEGVLKTQGGTAFGKMLAAKMDGPNGEPNGGATLAEAIKDMRIAAKTGSLPGDMGGLTVVFTPNGIIILFGAGSQHKEVWGSALAQYAVRTAIKSVNYDASLSGPTWNGATNSAAATIPADDSAEDPAAKNAINSEGTNNPVKTKEIVKPPPKQMEVVDYPDDP